MPDKLGVLGSSGRERRDIDLIRNGEGAIETKSEYTNEVSASVLVASGLEQEVSGLPLAYSSTNVPLQTCPTLQVYQGWFGVLGESCQCQYLLQCKFHDLKIGSCKTYW